MASALLLFLQNLIVCLLGIFKELLACVPMQDVGARQGIAWSSRGPAGLSERAATPVGVSRSDCGLC